MDLLRYANPLAEGVAVLVVLHMGDMTRAKLAPALGTGHTGWWYSAGGALFTGREPKRLTTLFLIAAFAASTVGAASYQKIDGTIVDPILAMQDRALVYSDYSGPNLEPDANLKNVVLTRAFLWDADLTNANLSYADLYQANWEFSNWTDAYLLHRQRTDLGLWHGSSMAGLGGHPGD